MGKFVQSWRQLCAVAGLLMWQTADARDESGVVIIAVGIFLGAAVLIASLVFFLLRWLRAPYLRASLRLLIVVSFVAPVPTYPGICPAGLFWIWLALSNPGRGGAGMVPPSVPSAGFFATAVTYVILLPAIFLWTDRRERLRRERMRRSGIEPR